MRIQRKYPHTDLDGNHWPDADVGDELWYHVDFSCWYSLVDLEGISVMWDVPEGIEGLDDALNLTIASIKLKALRVGTYIITARIHSNIIGLEQVQMVPMKLKVF